jgi:hypothetical protein
VRGRREHREEGEKEGRRRRRGRGGREKVFFLVEGDKTVQLTQCFYPGAVPPGWFIYNTTATRRKPKLKGKHHEIVYRGFFFQ